MFTRKAFVGLLAALVVCALALPALAQETTTGTLEGKVIDDKGAPVAGASVSVTGPQGLQATRTASDGKYSIPFLAGGKYEVKVEATGYSTIIIKDVEVAINRRTNLPIQMTAGKVETVTVQAQAPMIDVKSTTIGQNIKVGNFINYVPIGRTYSDTFATAPGVVGGGGTGAGNFSISGASGLENQYIVDGVNITNTGYGGIGSYNIVYGSLGTGVTTNFLDEVQVKTGGFEAEYGGATGGILNTTVKTGTNKHSGSLEFFYTPAGTYSTFTPISLSTGAVTTEDMRTIDSAFSIGGPILRDKLFYFAAYNEIDQRDRFTVESTAFDPRFVPATGPGAGATTFPAAELGPQARYRLSHTWAAKVTWYLSANHRFEMTGFGDPSKGKVGPQNSNALRFLDYEQGGGDSEIFYGSNNYSLKYNAVFTPSFFAEFQASRHKGKFRETPVVEETRVRDRRQQLCALGPQVPGRCPDDLNTPENETGKPSKSAAVWFTGGPGFVSNSDDLNDTYTAKLTNLLGPVELKYGIEYADIRYTDQQGYSGKSVDFFIPIDVDGDGDYENAGEGVVDPSYPGGGATLGSNTGTLIDNRTTSATGNFRAVRNRFNTFPGPTTTEDLSGFVQATWTITPAWTLRVGARVTQQKISGHGDAFTLPFKREYNASCQATAPTPNYPPCLTRVPGETVYEHSDYTFDTEISPRVGVTWDVTGDGRSKAYANFGRYFERIPNDLAVRSLSTEISTTVYRFRSVDPVTNQPMDPDPAVNPASTIFFNGLDPTFVRDDTKLPYKDELVAGYAYQIRPNLAVEIRGIYRKQGRVLEDVQFSTNESIQNFYYGTAYGYPYDPFGGSDTQPLSTTFPANVFGAYQLANPGENTPGSSFPKPKHTYKAMEVILTKRLSDHWLAYANYRYSKVQGNYEGLFRNDNGQSDPNITSLFDFPNSPTMRGQFQSGYLNNDRPHVLNIYGAHVWDNSFTLGASFNWLSGIPRTPLLAHPNYQNAGEIPGVEPIYLWWSNRDEQGDGTLDSLHTARGSSSDFQNDRDSLAHQQLGSFFPILADYKDCARGCYGRTPDEVTINVHGGYTFKLKDTNLDVGIDIFNIFNSQEPNGFDDFVESTAGILEPDFGAITSYQPPRRFRFYARWSF